MRLETSFLNMAFKQIKDAYTESDADAVYTLFFLDQPPTLRIPALSSKVAGGKSIMDIVKEKGYEELHSRMSNLYQSDEFRTDFYLKFIACKDEDSALRYFEDAVSKICDRKLHFNFNTQFMTTEGVSFSLMHWAAFHNWSQFAIKLLALEKSDAFMPIDRGLCNSLGHTALELAITKNARDVVVVLSEAKPCFQSSISYEVRAELVDEGAGVPIPTFENEILAFLNVKDRKEKKIMKVVREITARGMLHDDELAAINKVLSAIKNPLKNKFKKHLKALLATLPTFSMTRESAPKAVDVPAPQPTDPSELVNTKMGYTALHQAVAEGKVADIEAMSQHVNFAPALTMVNAFGETPELVALHHQVYQLIEKKHTWEVLATIRELIWMHESHFIVLPVLVSFLNKTNKRVQYTGQAVMEAIQLVCEKQAYAAYWVEDKQNGHALLLAAEANNRLAIDTLLQFGVPIDVVRDFNTVMSIAYRCQHWELLAWLIVDKAYPLKPSDKWRDVLLPEFARITNKTQCVLSAIEKLMSMGSNLEVFEGATSLVFERLMARDFKVLSILVDSGQCDLRVHDEDGETLLHLLVILYQNHKVAQFTNTFSKVLKQDPTLLTEENAANKSVLSFLFGFDPTPFLKAIKKSKIILPADASVHTMFFYAVSIGCMKALRFLCEWQSDCLQARNAEGYTVLHAAVIDVQLDVVRWLSVKRPRLLQDEGDIGELPLAIATGLLSDPVEGKRYQKIVDFLSQKQVAKPSREVKVEPVQSIALVPAMPLLTETDTSVLKTALEPVAPDDHASGEKKKKKKKKKKDRRNKKGARVSVAEAVAVDAELEPVPERVPTPPSVAVETVVGQDGSTVEDSLHGSIDLPLDQLVTVEELPAGVNHELPSSAAERSIVDHRASPDPFEFTRTNFIDEAPIPVVAPVVDAEAQSAELEKNHMIDGPSGEKYFVRKADLQAQGFPAPDAGWGADLHGMKFRLLAEADAELYVFFSFYPNPHFRVGGAEGEVVALPPIQFVVYNNTLSLVAILLIKDQWVPIPRDAGLPCWQKPPVKTINPATLWQSRSVMLTHEKVPGVCHYRDMPVPT